MLSCLLNLYNVDGHHTNCSASALLLVIFAVCVLFVKQFASDRWTEVINMIIIIFLVFILV